MAQGDLNCVMIANASKKPFNAEMVEDPRQ
jgi:hypothetical protein